MAGPVIEQKVVENALHQIGDVSASDPLFVAQMTSLLETGKRLYETNKDAEWVKAATFGAQQLSRTARFAKTVEVGADKIPLLLSMTPQRALVATIAVMSEKAAFAAGIASDNEKVKCGAALAGLAANTTAMLILGAGTGGVAIAFTAVSLASSLMTVSRECRPISDSGEQKQKQKSEPEPTISLQLH